MKATPHDVVVVGSGAGGGACAWALTQQGVKVLILEAGPGYDPFHDYRLHLPDWETSPFPIQPALQSQPSFAPLQALEERWRTLRSWNRLLGLANPGPHRAVQGYQHVRGVGGSTLHFSGEAHRLHPSAMNMRSDHGVAADWPITYAELEPFYTLAERIVGVAGGGPEAARPRSAPYPLPAHDFSHASRKLEEGCARLGLHWTPNPVAILSRPYDGRPACNYCGNCARGCPRTDKGSVDVTFLRRALASGLCELRTHCEVMQIEPGKQDRIQAVRFRNARGDWQRVETRTLVLACGAVETPRLLLLSATPAAGRLGLANESGQVGRNFMETISWVSNGLHPEPLGSHRGIPSDGICWDFNAPRAIPEVIGGCRFTLSMAESSLLGPLSYARRVVGGWGRKHKQAMRETFGKALGVGGVAESLPHPETFIDLDPGRKDVHGRPLARIHSFLDEMAIRRIHFMATRCRDILAASGVREIFEEIGTYDLFQSTHVFGTCRMGNRPEDSVVDRYGRSHRWRNLFVADASVFPSSGGGEAPSLTIEALAIRTGQFLAQRLTRREL
jgi:choline dehydrogenase-like flavoprotein